MLIRPSGPLLFSVVDNPSSRNEQAESFLFSTSFNFLVRSRHALALHLYGPAVVPNHHGLTNPFSHAI